MIRKTFFWIHLIFGVTVGLVVAMMSVTGVILTYERQLLAWADRELYGEPAPGAERLALEALVTAVKQSEPQFAASSLTISADPAAPVSVGAGRAGARYVNAYTGAVLGAGATRLRDFFDAVTGWHRWFNVDGEGRAPWRAITGASNLVFLFLILSGMYLWLPRVYRWAAFKARLTFASRPPTSHARDFNWHHVFGIWSAVPLAVVVATATVFSYPWASDLVYRSVGEEPPRGRGEAPAAPQVPEGGTPVGVSLPLDALFQVASTHVDEWQRISLQLPAERDSTVRFTIDQGNGGQPHLRHGLTLDAYSGNVVAWQPFATQSTGQRARSYIRFLHTGEALGVLGQTIAGLVSFTSVIMVWTGLALAYRRLVAPLLARRFSSGT